MFLSLAHFFTQCFSSRDRLSPQLIISLATAMAEASPAVNGESPDQHVFVDDDGNMWGEDELGRYRRPMETKKSPKSMKIHQIFP